MKIHIWTLKQFRVPLAGQRSPLFVEMSLLSTFILSLLIASVYVAASSAAVKEPHIHKHDRHLLNRLKDMIRKGEKVEDCHQDGDGHTICEVSHKPWSMYRIVDRLLNMKFDDKEFRKVLIYEMRKECQLLGYYVFADDSWVKYRPLAVNFIIDVGRSRLCRGDKKTMSFKDAINGINHQTADDENLRNHLTRSARELCPNDPPAENEYKPGDKVPVLDGNHIESIKSKLLHHENNGFPFRDFMHKKVECEYDRLSERVKRLFASMALEWKGRD